MFRLKPLTHQAIGRALAKVERYRLLNEPHEAESICRDVLDIDPENQEALVSLLLSLTDRFADRGGPSVEEARQLVPRLADPYQRAYYSGIACERKGTATLGRDAPGTGPIVYQWLVEAMKSYEEAEAQRPPGNDDAILRWNTCARLIMKHKHVRPAPAIRQEILLE